MSLPPYRRNKGAAFIPPPQISRLPISLLRTALITRAPELSALGADEYYERMDQGEDYEPPVMMPQKLLFQGHKQDIQTDGRNRPLKRAWLSSVDSVNRMVKASHVPHSTVQRTVQPKMTFEQARAARRYGGEFPEPPRDLEPLPVLSRDLPRGGKPQTPPPDAFIEAERVTQERVAMKRHGSCQRALFEAAATRARVRALIETDDDGEPTR